MKWVLFLLVISLLPTLVSFAGPTYVSHFYTPSEVTVIGPAETRFSIRDSQGDVAWETYYVTPWAETTNLSAGNYSLYSHFYSLS